MVLVDRYFGLPVRRVERKSLSLHEAHHPQGEAVPWHRHARTIVTVVLSGLYVENRNGEPNRIEDGCIVVHDASEEIEHFLSPTRVLNIAAADDEPFADLVPGVYHAHAHERLGDTMDALRIAWDRNGSANAAFRLARESIAILAEHARKRPPPTPRRVRTITRINTASEALIDSAAPLAEIACSCGFADQSHLTRVFSSLVGMPPAAYRKRFMRSPQNVQDSGSVRV